MDDFEAWEKQYEARRNLERQYHTKLISDTVGHDGELLFELLTMKVAQRFGLLHDCYEYSPCYKIVNHYVNSDVTLGFSEWLYSDNAPFVCPTHKIGKYFPEFKKIGKSDRDVVKLANKIYGLDLKVDGCGYESYVYAYSLDLDSFVPIDLEKVKELKQEIGFCKKYGLETDKLEDKLSDYGVSYEALRGESDEKIHS